jgi:hypothetical protein
MHPYTSAGVFALLSVAYAQNLLVTIAAELPALASGLPALISSEAPALISELGVVISQYAPTARVSDVGGLLTTALPAIESAIDAEISSLLPSGALPTQIANQIPGFVHSELPVLASEIPVLLSEAGLSPTLSLAALPGVLSSDLPLIESAIPAYISAELPVISSYLVNGFNATGSLTTVTLTAPASSPAMATGATSVVATGNVTVPTLGTPSLPVQTGAAGSLMWNLELMGMAGAALMIAAL